MTRRVSDENIVFPFKIPDLFVKQPVIRRQTGKKHKRNIIGRNQIQPIVNGPQGRFKNLFRQCRHLHRIIKSSCYYYTFSPIIFQSFLLR